MSSTTLQSVLNILNIARIPVISIGFIGNILTFIVFSRKVFAKNSISTYCRCLAVFDCFPLIRLVNDIGTYFFNASLQSSNELWCKLSVYGTYSLSAVPSFILLLFALDKLIGVSNTNKFGFFKKRSFQYGAIASFTLFSLLLYIEIPISLTVLQVPYFGVFYPWCEISTIPFANSILLVYLIETNFLTFVVLLVINAWTIRGLYRSRVNLERTGNNSTSISRKRKEKKYAISSIVFCVLFVVLKVPYSIAYLQSNSPFTANPLFAFIAYLLFLVYFSSGVFIHFASNSIFRSELLKMFGLKKKFLASRVQNGSTGNGLITVKGSIRTINNELRNTRNTNSLN